MKSPQARLEPTLASTANYPESRIDTTSHQQAVSAARGKNGSVFFDGRLIVISKIHSLGTLLNQGIQGDRHIVAKMVTAVEFRDAVGRGNGFIAFDFPGKNPPRGGVFDALADENAEVFTAQQRAEFLAIRDRIVTFLADL